YSPRGPESTDPAKLLRSYLLMLQVGQPSITDWVDDLRRVPLYAVLSGFEYGNTPGVGTFYDFFKRLWNCDSINVSPRRKLKRHKPKRGKKKGEKAPTTTSNKIGKLIAQLQKRPLVESQPFDTLLSIFQGQFLAVSAKLGILGDTHNLVIAGDGTPVQTSAQPRSKRMCACREQGIEHCSCHRQFSQPDCDIGWDSHRSRYFFGYHLYMLVAADSPYDLPIYPRLQRASRHDATSWVVSAHEFTNRFPDYTWASVILDAAHDAMPIYEYLKSQRVTPFIDMNQRRTGHKQYKDDIMISDNGIPICSRELEMKDDGYDHTRGRRKYRCPLVTKGVVTCDTPCSDSPYGRCVYTYTKDNPRLFPPVARHSDEWASVYKRRTTCERSNKREKEDYHLEAAKHRSTMMWTIRIYGIAMCQHMDAWYQESKLDLKSMLLPA
ncbi:transposase, partial [Alicyclobacillus acidiphilus]|uniref:transposase n=2 Tax=Alicyclobacillus acidiphilus TaxID=182455 RepID=UPI00083389C1